MKKGNYQFALLLLSTIWIGTSCDKTEVVTGTGQAIIEGTDEIIAPDAFDWSASYKGTLTVNIENIHRESVENELLNLVDNKGFVLAKELVQNNKAVFQLRIPQDANFYVEFPKTGDRVLVEEKDNITLKIKAAGKFVSQKTNVALACASCNTSFENGNAESPITLSGYQITNANNVPSWETTATDNKIEIWTSGFNGVPAQQGNQFFEINANQSAALYQEVCLLPGATITWTVYHRGRSGVDVAEVLIGSSIANAATQVTMTDGTSSWGYYTGTYTVPAGQNTTFFVFKAISQTGGSSYGNFIDNFQIRCDEDGDGVIDGFDDYPTDPTRAYKSYFPSAGKQIVAFEDLWPSLGDFDFNDMILANQAVISKNANGDLVDAQFKVSVDAIGAGLHNGIAMMIYDASNAAFGANIIGSVTGDAVQDPSNVNGLILTDNVFATIPDYYQNNGTGPSATPDTLYFTVNFNTNAVGADFTPELYLFRSGDRTHEVHLSGNPNTATINTALFSTEDDNGNYKTVNGLPWGLEIYTSGTFKHPLEKIDILDAYSLFQNWATSGGSSNVDWHTTPDLSKVFPN